MFSCKFLRTVILNNIWTAASPARKSLCVDAQAVSILTNNVLVRCSCTKNENFTEKLSE